MTTGGPISRTKDDLPAGTTIGRYRVEHPVGRGGMGTVYSAFDETTNRNVALKLLAEGIPESLRERFLAECEAEANIRHEHVMPVYDRGWLTDERPYFVMELLYEPITLGELMDVINSGKLGASMPRLRQWNDPRRLIADVILPICEGVDVANNEYGIQHRDLKPDNVLIDVRTRRAYLIDFGICRELDDEKDRGRIVGTPRFLSPEQARARTHERTDVWGLGALVRYVITGEPPLAGTSPFTRAEVHKRIAALVEAEAKARAAGEEAKATGYERRRKQLEDPTLRVQEDLLRDAADGIYLPLPEETSAGLAAVIQKAMAKEPAQRYATAGELARDLRTWVQGGSVQALQEKSSRGALVDLARRLLNRNVMRGAGALVALVVGLALGAGLFTKTPPPPDHRADDALADLGRLAAQARTLQDQDAGNAPSPAGLAVTGRLLAQRARVAAERGLAAADEVRRTALERVLGDVRAGTPAARVRIEGWRPTAWEVVDLVGQAAPAEQGAGGVQRSLGRLPPGVHQVVSTTHHGVRLLLAVPAAPDNGFARAADGVLERTIVLGAGAVDVPADMIWIPAGPAELGSDVVVPPFLAGRDFVTNEKYSEWLDDLPAAERATRVPPTGFVKDERDPQRWLVAPGVGSKPVLGVRPQDAGAYAAWRRRVEGAEIGLPTERQWQRMAALDRMQDRGAGHIFPWRGALQWKVRHRRGVRGATTRTARIAQGESPYGVRGLYDGPGEIVAGAEAGTYVIKGRGGLVPLPSAAMRSEPVAPTDEGHGFGFRLVLAP